MRVLGGESVRVTNGDRGKRDGILVHHENCGYYAVLVVGDYVVDEDIAGQSGECHEH